jgi:3-carboxy-cis,cis-muconate cycloisomerase
MLDVEAALAAAQPKSASFRRRAADASPRAVAPSSTTPTRSERGAQRRQPGDSTRRRADQKRSAKQVAARGYVHWGATSQDIIDTALVLQLRDALALIERDIARLDRRLAVQIRLHRAP